jgi:hypothetical protein
MLADVPTDLPLVDISANPGPGFPLAECQGDCDNDDQCQVSQRCVASL